ncbi:cdh-3 [Pristionchus pacificus]|nr:cdh-3 [Pristionchus pacificus]
MIFLSIIFLFLPSVNSFTEEHFRFAVSEDASPGQLIGRIPLREDGIQYRVSKGDDRILFDTRSGQISLLSLIDRERSNGSISLLLITSLPSLTHVFISILDVNDNSPVFPSQFYNVSLIESAPLFTQLVLPSAIDADFSENGTIVSYEIEDSSSFSIIGDPPLLILRLISPLDREIKDVHILNISASDGGNPSRKGFMVVYVSVMDVNDNEPIVNREKEVIEWNGRTNEVITTVHADDDDLGENGRVSLSIGEEYRDSFTINDEGIITSTKSIGCSPCIVRIEGRDHGDPPLSSFTTITIYHKEENNHEPVITIKVSGTDVDFAVVGEDVPVGKVIAVLTVSDVDGPIKGVGGLHVISPPEIFNRYFSLDTQGRFALLRLKMSIKEESQKIEVEFSATDGERSTTNSLTIFIGSDWKSRVSKSHSSSIYLSSSLPMDSPIGSLVTIIPSSEGSSFKLKTNTKYFQVHSIAGFVTVSSSLYSINLTDISLEINKILPPPSIEPVQITLNIHIDRVSFTVPNFIDLPQSIEIDENTLTGTQIGQLHVNDQNGKVLFSLEDDEERLEVDEENGKITLKESIDYETRTSFMIVVSVCDSIDKSKKSSKMIRVIVKPSNEFAPSFGCSDLHLSLSLSHSPLHSLTTITASDADHGIHGEISYMLLDPLPSYSIDPRKGEISIHEIPTEERTDLLRITAIDGGGRSSERNLSLSIHWRKGKGLEFNEDEDSIEIDEKIMRVGEIIRKYETNDELAILSMEAPFLSLSSKGEISLSSLPPPSVLRLSFRILAKSGESMATMCGTMKINRLPSPPKFRHPEKTITLDSSPSIGGPLARLSVSSPCSFSWNHSMISISKEGIISLTSAPIKGFDRWTIPIKCEDSWGRSDSMQLHFVFDTLESKSLPSHWLFFVSESSPPSTFIGRLTGNDSHFLFHSNGAEEDIQLFPNGVVYVGGRLDRERKREYSLIVEVRSSRNSFYRSSGVIRIVIKDENDNRPTCEEGRIVEIPEDAAVGSIVATLFSIDEDDGINGIIKFTLSNNIDRFHLNSQTGELRLLRPLDAESESSFSIEYSVSDLGDSPLSSECSISISIRDVNESPPIFDQVIYSSIIDGKEGEEVISVYASESDREWNRVRYSLKSHYRLFKINETSGRITVLHRLSPNGLYSFTVRAEDNGEDNRLSSEVPVKITVRDNRKAKPIFVPSNETTINISRNTRVGDIVGHVEVNLPSSNSVSFSSLSGPLDIDWLGQLILVQPLRDRRLSLPSLIQASSNQGKTTARITVVPQSEESIDELPKELIVNENLPPGTLVGSLPSSSSIIFQYPSISTFKLSPSGNLITTRIIDREQTPSFSLLVSHSIPPRTSLITVSIGDENDSSPVCDGVKSFVVRELPAIFPLSCWDTDLGDNGTVRYRQLDELEGIRVRPEGTLVVTVMGESIERVRVEAFDQPSSSDSIRKRTEMEIVLLREKEETKEFRFPNDEIFLRISTNAVVGKTIGKVEIMGGKGVRYFITRSSFPSSFGSIVKIDEKNGHLSLHRIPFSMGNVTVTAVNGERMAQMEVSLSLESDIRILPSLVFPLWKRAQKGAIVGRLHGEKGTTYSMEEHSPFTVSPIGEISLNGDIRVETLPYYRLEITVVDKDGRAEQTVYVLSVDEHADTDEYGEEGVLFVRENAHYGSVIGWMGDWTKEDGPYSVNGDEDTVGFRIDLSGLITLAREVDYEKSRLHSFEVNLPSGTSFPFLVFVEDENEHSPKWIDNIDSYSFSIKEDSPIGMKVGRLEWSDQDDANLFSISVIKGDPSGHFSIDNRGVITVSGHLDREITPSYTLQVELRDHASPYKFHSLRALIRISLLDVNDNSPIFDSPSIFFISESSKRKTVVGSVRAVDKDEGANGRVRYRIKSETLPRAYFILDPVLGYLIVNRELNFESQSSFHFTIMAEDEGKPSRMTEQAITVEIIDENNNELNEISIDDKITVSEDAPRGTVVGRGEVIDEHGTKINSSVLWISSDYSPFSFTPNGHLIVNGPLDFESNQSINLTVSAKNIIGGESIARNITVDLEDVNDEIPRFVTGSNLFIRVSEALSGPFPVIIGSSIADDLDSSSHLAYSLLEGNTSLFSIDSITGDLSLLSPLDREIQSIHHLQVQSTDDGIPRLSSQCEITVEVEDANDLAPIFDLPLYEIHIKEGIKIGEKVIEMKAIDGDEGDNGIVRYSLIDEMTPFTIDAVTGWISIGKKIDREVKDEYLLTVVATDLGRYTQLSSSSSVRILIDDVNDNHPFILNSHLDVYLNEELEIGDIVWPIISYDADPSSSISFSIDSSSPFLIDGSNGIIRLASPLTQPHYSVVVTVRDNGGLNTTASFSFYLESARKFPRFIDERMEENRVITEGEEGELIRVNAIPPQGEFLVYSILTPCVHNFAVDSRSGVIRYAKLQRNRSSCSTLFIVASTSSTPPLSTLLPVSIDIEDANDHSPVFEKMLYIASVMENSPEGTILEVKAIDEDDGVNGEVYYEIHDEGEQSKMFEIDEESGELRSLGMLDRETIPVHTLTIVAKDRGVPQRMGKTTVKITVDDENDNAPRFTRLYGVSVREGTIVPHDLITVEAVDADSSSELEYSLEDNANVKLSIDSTTGKVTLLKELDREESASIRVGVIVSDGRWRVRTMLRVNLIDVNDNSPQFERDEEIIWIGEETANAIISKINATDKDEGDNGIIDFSLLPNQKSIRISPKGEIIMEERPKGCIKLKVTASDRGIPSLSASINLLILSPECSFLPLDSLHSLPLISSLPIGSTIARLRPPKGETGKISFSLLGNSSILHLDSNGRLWKSGEGDKRQEITVVAENERGVIYATNVTIFPWTEPLPDVIQKSYSILLKDINIGSTLHRLHSSSLPLLPLSSLPHWLSLSSPGRLTLTSFPPLYLFPMEIPLHLYFVGCPQCNTSTILHLSTQIDSLPLVHRIAYTFNSHPLDSNSGCLSSSSSSPLRFSIPSSPLPSLSIDEKTGCLTWWSTIESTKVAVLVSSSNSLQLVDVEMRRITTIGEISLRESKIIVERSEKSPVGLIIGKVDAVGNSVVFVAENSEGLVVDRRNGEIVVREKMRKRDEIEKEMIVYARSGRVVQRASIKTEWKERESSILSALSPIRMTYPVNVNLPIDILSLNYSLPSDVEMRVEGDDSSSFCPDGSTLRLCHSLPSSNSSFSLLLFSLSTSLPLTRSTLTLTSLPSSLLPSSSSISPLSGWIRENSPPSTILHLHSTIPNATYRITDESMAKLFSIDSSGIISSLAPLDRESRSLYLIPLSIFPPSSPSSFLPPSLSPSHPSPINIRIHIDDEIDSLGAILPLTVSIVEPIDGSIGSIFPSKGDLIPYSECEEMVDEHYEVSSSCVLWPRSTDLPSKHTLSIGREKRSVRITREESPIALLAQSITIRIFASQDTVAGLLSGLKKQYSDMGIHPLGVNRPPEGELDDWRIIIMMKDRNGNGMAFNETEAVIKSSLKKTKSIDYSLHSITPTNSCPSICPSSCIISSSFLPHSFSLRSPSSLWSLPNINIHISCPSSSSSSSSLSLCSPSICNGECDGHHCVCPLGWKGDNCTEDVDECQAPSNPCPSHGLCINTRGAFQCVCADGSCGEESTQRVEKIGEKRVYGINQLSSLQAATRTVNYTLEFEIRTTSQYLPVLPPLLFIVNGRLRLISTNFSFPISSGAWHRLSLSPHSLSISSCSSYGICPPCSTSSCHSSFLHPLPTLLTFASPMDNSSLPFSSCLRGILLSSSPLHPSSHSTSPSCSVPPSLCLSKDLCKEGVCISDGIKGHKCVCESTIDASHCRDVGASVHLDGGSIVFHLRENGRRRLEKEKENHEEISIDFKTNREDSGNLIAFEHKGESITIEIRLGHIVLSLLNGLNKKNELRFNMRIDDEEWHRIQIRLMKERKIMRIRVDTEGKEIRSLHSFPPLLSPSLERISLGPFSSLCIRRFVVDKQLQPLFTNATLLPSQLFDSSWKGSISSICPSSPSSSLSSFISSILSWPVLLIFALLLLFIGVALLFAFRWARFKGSKKKDSSWSRRSTREIDGRLNMGMDRSNTPGYEIPSMKGMEGNGGRSSSLYYQSFTSPDLYVSRERDETTSRIF